ncbi:DUF202 domain-containing protein [Microbacterium telephonicum]|uniref:Uncharacterized protein DUF202 n=1 Tax=Microbacterium telephonicum TaxID=1714841 RepID=A0A498CAV1_9MICO|nr:DUF202 domain-containing protein [Microbacterium telephonicum]RLK52623.1 uncharacterized protein DUF202 [Microbacterium telephonicum]
MSVFDPGLQPERTELAWRRTALALGVGSLVSMRLLPVALGDPWWILAGMTGLVVAALVWVAARRRYRAASAALLRDGDRARMPGAGLLLGMALVTIATAVLAVAIVLVGASGGLV